MKRLPMLTQTQGHRALAASLVVVALALGGSATKSPEAFAATCSAYDLPQVPTSDPAAEAAAAEPDNGRIAGPEVNRAIGEAVVNYVVCWNSDNVTAVVSMMSGPMISEVYGVSDPYEAMEAIGTIELPIHVITGDNVRMYEDGRASVDLAYESGEYGYVDARWFWVSDNGVWRLDEEVSLPPDVEGDKAFVSYSIADDTSPAVFDHRNAIAAPPVLVIHGVNNGAELHHIAVYQLSAVPGEGEALETIPDDATLIGSLSILAGDQEDYALVGLPSGAYAVVSDSAAAHAVIELTEPCS
ncbi:MAG: hypothetical protein ACKOCK_03290 [Chloroflexota bacterium]